MIDDLEEVRDQHRVILRHAGITETAEAADGRQAIELLTDPANQFDLILCDLQMPRLDGVETIRALSYMGVQGAVAVLSVEEEQVMAGAGFLAEAHGLHYIGSLAKPLTREKLDEILQRMREPPAAEPAGGVPRHPTAADVARGLDDDEFALFYQPQLHMQSGRLHGVEALIRWRHPTRGLLTANSFMPAVHDSNALLVRIADFIVDRTTAFAARWRARGRHEPVAMNLPGAAMEILEFPERLEALAAKLDLPHEALRVEVSEQEVAADAMLIVDVAARLRLKRFGVSIDQFGGSEFGLQHLSHLPVNEVKLTPAMVQGCATTPTKQAMLDATLTLAGHRKMLVVAEGVRHRADWEYLRAAGCHAGQGNYIVRALGQEMLDEWVGRW
ncbi:MAG: EAL domain-containing response regulator [Gemmatimonadota bacterium]|nr:EAL domain-containing response regulator [Gemmatimonadota bacterium]